jgi:hypothetical protein
MLRRIGLQLIHELSEAGKVIRDWCSLFNMEQLANQVLVPIAIKAAMNVSTKIIP